MPVVSRDPQTGDVYLADGTRISELEYYMSGGQEDFGRKKEYQKFESDEAEYWFKERMNQSKLSRISELELLRRTQDEQQKIQQRQREFLPPNQHWSDAEYIQDEMNRMQKLQRMARIEDEARRHNKLQKDIDYYNRQFEPKHVESQQVSFTIAAMVRALQQVMLRRTLMDKISNITPTLDPTDPNVGNILDMLDAEIAKYLERQTQIKALQEEQERFKRAVLSAFEESKTTGLLEEGIEIRGHRIKLVKGTYTKWDEKLLLSMINTEQLARVKVKTEKKPYVNVAPIAKTDDADSDT